MGSIAAFVGEREEEIGMCGKEWEEWRSGRNGSGRNGRVGGKYHPRFVNNVQGAVFTCQWTCHNIKNGKLRGSLHKLMTDSFTAFANYSVSLITRSGYKLC